MTNPQLILNCGKLKAFSIIPGTRQGCLLSLLLFNSIENPKRSNQITKINKRQLNWKGRSKQSLFVDDIILYIVPPEVSTKKLLKLIDELSNNIEYRINIQKSIAFLYINNEL